MNPFCAFWFAKGLCSTGTVTGYGWDTSMGPWLCHHLF